MSQSHVVLYCRPFVFQREPHVAFAMAIYDASLNLTEDSPNSYKQRTEVTGIARMNIRSKQVHACIWQHLLQADCVGRHPCMWPAASFACSG